MDILAVKLNDTTTAGSGDFILSMPDGSVVGFSQPLGEDAMIVHAMREATKKYAQELADCLSGEKTKE